LAIEKVRWNSLCSSDPSVFRRAHRLLQLAEDLRLAQHHRIEAGGDAERMARGVLGRQRVDVRLERIALELVVVGQPAGRVLRVVRAAVDLGPVAGGQDRRLGHRAGLHQVAQCLGHRLAVEGDPFAHLDRGALVVDADCVELHESGTR